MQSQDRSPFFDFRWGVERETHRMLADGRLSPRRHPEALPIPYFTLDFAESQLEIVTQPATSIDQLLSDLGGLTDRAQRTLSPELIWPFSMPPRLPDDAQIQVAQLDRRGTLYREGLILRYGAQRQMICGLHLNVSFGGAFSNWLSQVSPLAKGEDSYLLRLTRNLYRELEHFVLLFGASPARESSDALAISHRIGPAGYAGAAFLPYLDLSSVEAYVAGIRRGLNTVSAEFAALGLVRDGRVLQLNSNVFQSEKEFYAPIRLRQATLPGEPSLQALSRRGAGYLELRFFDVDPFQFAGLSEETLRLMHLFILDALVQPSPPPQADTLRGDLQRASEAAMIHPLLGLEDLRFNKLEGRLADLADWAQRLDQLERKDTYARVLASFRARAAHPHQLPAPTIGRRFLESGRSWTSFGIHTALDLRGSEYYAMANTWV